MSVFPPGPTIPGQPGTPAFPPPGPPPTPTPLPAAPTLGRGRGRREAFQDQQEAYAAQVAATNAANARASAAYNASLPPQTGLQANTGFPGSVQGAGNTSAPGFVPPSVSHFISPSAAHALGLAGGGLTLGAAMTQAGAQPNIFARPPINTLGIQDIGAGTSGMPSLRRGPVATGPGLDPSEGFTSQGGPGVGYRTPVTIMTGGGSMPSYMFGGSNDWTMSAFTNPQLFAELADAGSSPGATDMGAQTAGASMFDVGGGGPMGMGALGNIGVDATGFGGEFNDAFGGQSYPTFSDPMSGLQMPPVDTSQQNTPSWMAGIGGAASGAFDQFFSPSQQPSEIFQGGLPAQPEFTPAQSPDFSSMFQGGLPASPGPPETPPAVPDYQGGLPATPGSPPESTFAPQNMEQVFQGGLPAAPPPPEAPTPSVDPFGLMGGLPAGPAWSRTPASFAPSDAGLPSGSPGLTPDVVSPYTPFNISQAVPGQGPSDAGLPMGSPGLTPDVFMPPDSHSVQTIENIPNETGAPSIPGSDARLPGEFTGGDTQPAAPEAGPQLPWWMAQDPGVSSGMMGPEMLGPTPESPGFAPPQQAMETWNIPQSKADLLVQKYGQTPTLRQIVVGETGGEPFGFSFLGSGVDTPIDLTQPIEPQLQAALGTMASQAIPLIMGKVVGAGLTVTDIQGAAKGAVTPNYFPPGSGPGTGPTEAAPSNFNDIQQQQAGSFWSQIGVPEAPQAASPETVAQSPSGPPPFPTGQFASSVAPLKIGETGAVPNKVSGTVSFGDYENYPFITGGGDQGALPFGNYNIDFGGVGPKGSSLNYTPWGPAVAGVTTDAKGNAVTGTFWNNSGIEIHAVGNGPNSYTLGCFGITADSWPGFLSELHQFADQNGGQLTLSMQPGQNGAADAVATIAPKNPDMAISGEPPTAEAAVPPPDAPGVFTQPPAIQQPGMPGPSSWIEDTFGPGQTPLTPALTSNAPLIESVAQHANVGPDVLSVVAMEESRGNPNAGGVRGNKGLFQNSEGQGTGTAAQQIQGFQTFWDNHNIGGQIAAALEPVGLHDLSAFTPPQQAAIIQAAQFTPNRVGDFVTNILMGNWDVPATTTKGQAKDLGTTSFNDMVTAFTPRLTGGQGAWSGQPIPGPRGALDTGTQFASASPGGPMVDPGATIRDYQNRQWQTQQPPLPNQPRPPQQAPPGYPIVPGSPVWPYSGVQRI